MDRTAIEIALNRERAWLLETCASLAPEDLTRPATASEHAPSVRWSLLDHVVHLSGIEREFNAMIRRHIVGEQRPVGVTTNPDGSRRDLPDIMRVVHQMNEQWVASHRGKTLDEIVALGQQIRSETLALLALLTPEQLAEKVRGAPWGDGTVAAILHANALHVRMHWKWVNEELHLPEPVRRPA